VAKAGTRSRLTAFDDSRVRPNSQCVLVTHRWRARVHSLRLLYRFGAFELDEERFELRRKGRPLAVQRRVLEAMVLLINRRDRLVTKADLTAGPWSGSIVTDSALHRVIMVARKTLAEGRGRASPIQTVRGKGYRFMAEVEVFESPAASPTSQPPPEPGTANERGRERSFIGRQREIARLEHAFELAHSNQGSLVLVSGEPGIGKTRLVETFAAAVRLQGGEVWIGRGWGVRRGTGALAVARGHPILPRAT
jgi:DNA-binding winged helix-turn-helix (wHTH) protein